MNRNLNDPEIFEYNTMLKILASQQVSNQPDQICWCLEKNEIFSVRSYYQFLFNKGTGGFNNFHLKQIWKTKVPLSVAFFAWEAC